MPIVVNGVTLPEYADPADVPAAMRNMASGLLPLTGGVVTGIIDMSGQRIVGVGSPINAADAVQKQYVDAAISNITWGNILGKPTTFPPSTHSHGEYSGTSHLHDNRYYTEGESESRMQDWVNYHSGTASHDGRYYHRWDIDWLIANHGHGYLPLSGGTVNGQTVFSQPHTTYFWRVETQYLYVVNPSSVDYKIIDDELKLTDAPFEKLSPIAFAYKETPGKPRLGFTYEQVQEIAPDWAVTTGLDKTKSVDYIGMIPDFMAWAVAAIKDLRDKLPAETDDSKVSE